MHPAVSLDMAISDRTANIVEDQIDVAVRAGPLTDSGLIARPIGLTRRIAVGSFDYLRRRPAPTQPQDLKRHDCLAFSGAAHPQQWDFVNAQGTLSVKVPCRPSVRAGLGIAVMPSWFCQNALSDGSFMRILSDTSCRPKRSMP